MIKNIDIPYIIKHKERLAELIMQTHYEWQPRLRDRYTQRMHRQCITDLLYTFKFLKLSIESGDDNIFIQYIKWLKILLVSYHVPVEGSDHVPVEAIKMNFEVMLDVLDKEGQVDEHIRQTIEKSIGVIVDTYSSKDYESEFETNEEICKTYLDSLLNVNRQKASSIILDLYYKQKMSIKEIYLTVIQPVMHEVGRLWQRNIITVSQEHYCSSATQWIMARLYHEIFNDSDKKHVYLGACVSEELHEMGGRMVADIFELEGWDSHYLGANTPTNGLIQFIKRNKVDVLGLSATMTMHVEEVKKTIECIRKDDECRNIKIIVGGYIFNQSPKLSQYVGADGWSIDAEDAYKLGHKLVHQNIEEKSMALC